MSISSVSNRESQTMVATKLNQSPYKVDQQVKFMHLQAEVDCLLQELKHLQLKRLATNTKQE